jgi:hypothetical protein
MGCSRGTIVGIAATITSSRVPIDWGKGMALADLLRTTTTTESPLSGSAAPTGTDVGGGNRATQVSDFLTVQSLTNFAAMTGAITAAWNALRRLDTDLGAVWVPYAFAGIFALVSLAISAKGFKDPTSNKIKWGDVFAAVFIAVINGLVLASAVVGTETVTETVSE